LTTPHIFSEQEKFVGEHLLVLKGQMRKMRKMIPDLVKISRAESEDPLRKRDAIYLLAKTRKQIAHLEDKYGL